MAEFKVDMAFWGHEHIYERLYPMYNYTIMKGSEDFPYTDAKAMVNIITGSAVS